MIATMSSQRLIPGIRILLGSSTAIGPGKAALLGAVEASGSIAAAARGMGMGYRRAWALVRSMNGCFREPLIVAVKGGARRGGARLTPTGRTVLELYRRMEAEAAAALREPMRSLKALMAEKPAAD